MAVFFDKLVDLVTGLGGSRDRTTTQSFSTVTLITPAEIDSMYRSDWISRKIIDIVPQDMVRAGRSWKASKEQITAIEASEQRQTINLWPKVQEALTRARLLGGAALFMGIRGQDPASELIIDDVGKDDFEYLTVIDRNLLSYEAVDRDPMSPWYGEPTVWRLSRSNGQTVLIHPSRLVRMIGAPVLTSNLSMYRETLLSGAPSDGVWGDSMLQVVYDAVKNANSVQQHVAGLVPDARNDVIYVPGLGNILQSPTETAKLTNRFAIARNMKSMFNMLLLDGNGQTGVGTRGEEWKQRQVSFTNLPELITSFLEIASAAADIPIVRFLGQSPKGMNSTGESDMRNYYDHVGSKRQLQLRPGLARIDEVNIRSALGTRPKEIYFEWQPLWALSETEKADILYKKAEAARKLLGTGSDTPAMHPLALSPALVNGIVEDGTFPGLDQSSIDHPLTEKDIVEANPPPPPVAAPFGGAANKNNPVAAAAKKKAGLKDAEPSPLYVHRQLLNTRPFLAWARAQGFVNLVPSDELHVTIVSSKESVDWLKVGTDWGSQTGDYTRPAGGPRIIEVLGKDHVVLEFASSELSYRHETMVERGASHDFPDYTPHVTFARGPQTVDLATVKPYIGELQFGPEIFEQRDL